jgi:hypothetical protein
MIVIRDCYKPTPRALVIRSKWGVWRTSMTADVQYALGHIDGHQHVFNKSVTSAECRVLFNGRRADLWPEDFTGID